MSPKASLGFYALLLFSAGAALAQSGTNDSKLQQEILDAKKACHSELEKYCKGVTPGEGRIADCLDSREDQLSPGCRKSWLTVKSTVSSRLDQQELAFRDSCGPDINKFCSDVPSGRGRLLECIGKNKKDLSPSCRNFEDSLDNRISSLFS